MKKQLAGILALLLMLIQTVIGMIPLMTIALLKLIVPIKSFRRSCTIAVMRIAETWAEVNKGIFALLTSTQWEVNCDIPLRKDTSYLIVCNHQSWVDIPALIQVLNRKVPFYKFFLKQELIWVPLLGLAWWALDYPFMKRYSKEQIARKPSLAGKDMEITRKACEKFRGLPVSVINFAEGTRFRQEKHDHQNSPYDQLLRPKAGGIAFALESLGTQLDAILDVTIVYPDGIPTFWDLMTNRIRRVVVDIQQIDIQPEWLTGGYQTNPEYRERFQQWVSDLWHEKDARIKHLQSAIN
ncbi:acyltransferase [Salinispirillum sp. LH 10-3-1]|uniref:Acyltransferase n=1 Tax=Salinispirillum sp. LH 10-3-1 TaxID=2952525 RepID=A0AB38YJ92_9GAMM